MSKSKRLEKAPPVRMLAVDIDGTLLNSSFQIPPANLSALRRAHEKGVEVVLVTGRRHVFAMQIAKRLGFDHWLITSNGAVTRSTQGEAFSQDLMSREIAKDFLALTREFRAHTILTFDLEGKGALVVENPAGLSGVIPQWLEKNSSYLDIVDPLEAALVADPIQVMICGTIKYMQEVEKHLSVAPPQKVSMVKTEYDARDLSLLDILSVNCSKGTALARWAQYRGVARSEIMAIGDNYNDIQMLEFAGQPVLMGNATRELKDRGWPVTLGNDESGLAVAVETVILNSN